MNVVEKEYRRLNVPAGDLRISITNGCNMKCTYCHNEGQSCDDVHFMSKEELKYIVKNAIRFGIYKVRITGGEPLIHPEIEDILLMLKTEFDKLDVGINTNGMFGDKLIDLCEKRLVSRVVVGLDYYDGRISKKSEIGVPSINVRNTVLILKEMGITVEIAVVLDENIDDIYKMVAWGLRNDIVIKIIEKTLYPSKELVDNNSYFELIKRIENDFQLRCGITADLFEYYLTNGNTKIKFFQSHCNRKECSICSRLHMRVTCEGIAEPCIMRKDTNFPLLEDDFEYNFKRAIANLGNGPQMPVI